MRAVRLVLFVCFVSMLTLSISGCDEVQKNPDTEPAVSELSVAPKVSNVVKAEVVADEAVVEKANSDPEKFGAIEVSNPTVELGEVSPNKVYNCEFNFKNVGTEILKIKKIQSTCGCAVPELAKKEYASGESGVVKVRFTSPKLPASDRTGGLTVRRLYIYSNDRENSKYELVLKCKVVLKVAASPRQLKLSLRAENGGAEDISISSKDDKEFSITEFNATAGVITVDIDPAAKAKEFVLKPKVDLAKLKKSIKGTIRIKLTHPECEHLNISFEAKPAFEIQPSSRIILRNVKPGKTVTREIRVVNNYDEAVEVESITSSKQITEIVSQEAVGNQVNIKLQITPPERSSASRRFFSDKLTIKIAGGENMVVNCSGWYAREK